MKELPPPEPQFVGMCEFPPPKYPPPPPAFPSGEPLWFNRVPFPPPNPNLPLIPPSPPEVCVAPLP
ncbi:Enabled protein homolog-related protein [Trichomonas vaginalis G3]|uniref:Enabled protein homolog-related protein n=1 Tax=Trichomonas vaginalis (strain ATCC PRA-98 / G3) TaxID=412133 RepID=A2FD37_TRIV3|nr:hypothetical protein TVAGG3_0834380 [Trichomonas vaginalis G3]EAX97189.1 Enabled protein homolog-related protein [Trichomonas vaginalis G3]KAI5498809.1 hypothetical protein TVAGG3_0834380 [Trichomonas vaginalis G3]|eukprot:XP_001310119.1 Enabled protein homolog-related protein [Trichomonas vaginalis G3]